MDILYGRNPVLEALRAGRPARKLVVAAGTSDEARLRQIVDLAASRGVPVEQVIRRRLDDIAHSEHHQGVAGYFHGRPPSTLDDVLAHAKRPQLLVVLDGIQDPQNLGAIIRSADAVGADGVVLPRHRATGVTAAAAKASAGATEHVDVCVIGNLVQALDRLRQEGVWVIGLDAEGGERYDTVDLTVPVAVVIGAEGEGMRQLTRRSCDRLVSLPMCGAVESLNAAAAAAVILYEVARQRGFTRSA